MEEVSQNATKLRTLTNAKGEEVLFRSGMYRGENGVNDPEEELLAFRALWEEIKAEFKPCVVIGKMELFEKNYVVCQYCPTFHELHTVLYTASYLEVRRKDSRLFTVRIESDHHIDMEVEVRKLRNPAICHKDGNTDELFCEEATRFAIRETDQFGDINVVARDVTV